MAFATSTTTSTTTGTTPLVVTPSNYSATINGTVTLTSNRPATFVLAPGGVGTLTTVDSTHATYTAPPSIPVQAQKAGCQILPNDSIFNTPINTAAVDSRSAAWVADVQGYGLDTAGAYTAQGTANAAQPFLSRKFLYQQPSRNYPFFISTTPFDREAGQRNNYGGDDHHTITAVVNTATGNCQWYETYADRVTHEAGLTFTCMDGSSGCNANSGIVYGPTSYLIPSNGSTSAAGTPVNLIINLEEIKTNSIHHAVGYTYNPGFIAGSMWPSGVTSGVGTAQLPYGSRLRLKASFDVSGYPQYAQNILNAFKTYGLILTDKGEPFHVTFDQDVYEDEAVRQAIATISRGSATQPKMTDFEFVDQDDLKLNSSINAVNPFNSEHVLPVGYAYVKAVDAAPVNGVTSSTGVGLALQGVSVGTPRTELTALAASTPYTYQLQSWVTGTTDQNVTWTLVSGPGSVSSSGLFTVPTNSTITQLTETVLTATAEADPNAQATVYIELLPFSSDGNFRMIMDPSNHKDNSSPTPFTWWADSGLSTGYLEFTGHDYPNWTNVAGNEQDIRQYAVQSGNDGDIHLFFILPNGNYRVRSLFGDECQNYCNAYPSSNAVFAPSLHGPEFINVNGQDDSKRYLWGAAVGYHVGMGWDYFAPGLVNNNTLSYWQGIVRTPSDKNGGNPYLSAIEIEPDSSNPYITIDTGLESWNYVTGANTTKPLTVAANAAQQLGAVGWYMSNAVTWSVTGGGSITATGLYTAPAAKSDPQTVTVTATSTVDATKTATATLIIPGNGTATITVTPASLTFPSTYMGATSAAQVFTVQNTGTATLTTSAITFGGTNAADFSQTSNCSSVAAGASCTVNVVFTPSTIGSETASLSIAGNQTGSPQLATVNGSGAQGVGSGSLAPGSLTFPNTQDGAVSSPLTLTLTNTGTGGLSSTVITITGPNAADFSQTNNCGGSLAPNGSCIVSVTFNPSIVGAESATLSISNNSVNSPQTATLSGAGLASSAVISANTAGLTFARTSRNQSINANVVFTNTGTGPLVIKGLSFTGANAPDFTEIDNCSTVAPGASCTALVTFKPSGTIGAETAALSIADNTTGSPHAVPINATGYYGGQFFLQPCVLMFPSRTVGTSATQTIVFSNTGGGALGVSSLSFNGPNAADFAQSNTCGSSIAANGSCTVSVTFTPSMIGVEGATLTIVDTGGYASPTNISVGGIGQ